MDAAIGNTRWSSAHYSWAFALHAPRGGGAWWTRVALAPSLVGRSEFTDLRAPASYSGPHVTPSGIRTLPYLCADASRHDYIALTVGLRVQVWQSIVLSLGVFHPLTEGGVQASGWSRVASFEGTF